MSLRTCLITSALLALLTSAPVLAEAPSAPDEGTDGASPGEREADSVAEDGRRQERAESGPAVPAEAGEDAETDEAGEDGETGDGTPDSAPEHDEETEDEETEDEETEDEETEDEEDVEIAPAPPTAPAPAPAFEAVIAGVPVRLTGIVHARIEFTQGVQSFDNATPVAPTSAVNPAVLADPDTPNLSFQVQQTRLGMQIGDASTVRAIVEIDFTHFDQSSPTVQAFPRIRIGLVEWQPAPNHRLFLGQTWDIFGNATGPQLLSHSFNLVGTLFRAGNIGFMRQQLGWAGRFDALELSIAAGLQGANTGPTFNNIEQSLVPTGALRVMLHVGERQVIGASAIATALRYTMADAAELRPAFGAVAFTDSQLGTFNLHAELYVAQNLAGTGALSLGAGRFGHDVLEVGGYVSGREQMGEHAITGGAGFAGVVSGDVAPGYTPANPMGTPPTTLGAITPTTGPGILWNTSAFLGYWYSPLPGLSIVIEPYFFITRFAIDPRDATLGDVRVSSGGRAGAMFQF